MEDSQWVEDEVEWEEPPVGSTGFHSISLPKAQPAARVVLPLGTMYARQALPVQPPSDSQLPSDTDELVTPPTKLSAPSPPEDRIFYTSLLLSPLFLIVVCGFLRLIFFYCHLVGHSAG